MQNQARRSSLSVEESQNRARQLRAACDGCHEQKVRCSGGGNVCTRCQKHNMDCHYSLVGRLGKPKGSKNKKTLERERLNALHTQANTLGSPVRSTIQDVEGRVGLQSYDSLGNGLDIHDALDAFSQAKSPGYSPSVLGDDFMDAALQSIDMGRSSIGEGLLSDSIMLEPVVQHEQSQALALSDFGGATMQFGGHSRQADPISFPISVSRTDSFEGGFEDNSLDELLSTTPSDVRGLLSPPLSLRSSQQRRGQEGESDIASFSSKSLQRLNSCDREKQCRCLATYADLLCSLRQEDGVDRLERLMIITDDAYPRLKASLQCSQCLHDSQAMQLCSMALKTLVGTIGTTCTSQRLSEVRIGEHILGRDDTRWIASLLAGRSLATFKGIVGQFTERLDRSRIGGRYEWQEQQYLDQAVRSIDRSMDLMLKHIRAGRGRNG